jgi:hypothetical protein
MAGVTHVVYDPPISSLPYLVVTFLPDGTVDVAAFKRAREADTFAIRMARATRRRRGAKEPEASN